MSKPNIRFMQSIGFSRNYKLRLREIIIFLQTRFQNFGLVGKPPILGCFFFPLTNDQTSLRYCKKKRRLFRYPQTEKRINALFFFGVSLGFS